MERILKMKINRAEIHKSSYENAAIIVKIGMP
jgi:hypothetical protein